MATQWFITAREDNKTESGDNNWKVVISDTSDHSPVVPWNNAVK